MKYNKGFIGIGIIIAIVASLVVGGGAVYFATKTPTSSKNIGENNYQPQENQNGVKNTPTQNSQVINTPKNEETADTITTTATSENIKTPLFIKNVYKKNGRWWADVDYVTKITPLEHMTRRINEGSCVLSGMTKNQMIEYAKNTVKKYVEQDNLLVVNCGYDWQGIWASDGGIPAMFINTNPLIRSFPFAVNFNGHEKQNEVCGGKNLYTPEMIKNDIELQIEGKTINQYSFDTYETKGYFQDSVIIENGEIKKFDGPAGCAN